MEKKHIIFFIVGVLLLVGLFAFGQYEKAIHPLVVEITTKPAEYIFFR
jgi:hypothetical protein